MAKKTTIEPTPKRDGQALDYSNLRDVETLKSSIIRGWLKAGDDMDRHLDNLDASVDENSSIDIKLASSKVFIVAYNSRLKAVEVMAKLIEAANSGVTGGRELPQDLTLMELRKLAKSMG